MAYRLLLLMLAFPVLTSLKAQQPLVLTDTISSKAVIVPSSRVFYYSNLHQKIRDVSLVKNERFRPLDSLNQQDITPSPLSEVIVWLRLGITNRGFEKKVILDVGKQGEIELYSDTGDLLQQTGAYFYPYNAGQWHPLLLNLAADTTCFFYVRITNRTRKGPLINPVLHSRETLANYLNSLINKQKKEMAILFFIDGFLLIMSLFAIVQFLFRKERVYLYYAIFCIAGSLMMLWNINYQFSVGFPLHFRNSSQVFAYLIAVFYALFLTNFIQLQQQFPKVWTVVKILIAVLCIQLAISLYENYAGLLFTSNFYYLKKSYSILAINMVLFACLLFSKTPFKGVLLFGAAFLWIPNFIVESSLVVNISNAELKSLIVNTLAGAAVLFENFLFLVALSLRNLRLEKERNNMQQKYANELKAEIESKTHEIEVKQELLQKQKLRHIETRLHYQIAETEMAALRAQMNPHFIFNCINSIDAFIHSNDKYNATLYLNKFAKLLRNILDSSKQNTVPFGKDIDTLRLYIELEELRHENKFKTNFRIQPELLNSDYKVPPLIIQPFVENAILHGLKNREDNNGLLDIDIKKAGGSIEYLICDNGIGRKAAALISQNKESSYGMQMSYTRIKLFNKEEYPSVEITDLYENDLPAGTFVKVHLKII